MKCKKLNILAQKNTNWMACTYLNENNVDAANSNFSIVICWVQRI